MRLSTVAVIVALALSGCNSSQYQAPDPFAAWGHSRVPPPGTRTLVAPGAASPYYQPSPSGGAVPNGTAPPFTVPGHSGAVISPSGYVPGVGAGTVSPGNWQSAAAGASPSSTSVGQYGSAATAQPAAPAAMGGMVGSGLAVTPTPQVPGQTQVAQPPQPAWPAQRTVTPYGGGGVSPVQPAGAVPPWKPLPNPNGTMTAPPQFFTPPANAIDISQLPRVPGDAGGMARGVISPNYGQQTAVHDNSVAMTGWNSTSASTGTAANQTYASHGGPPIAVQSGGYGYHGDYSWLKGKLEYSATARRWKLRYIPRDASEHRIDEFGGSVILADAGQLRGFSDGEFVRVDGRVAGHDAGVRGFAPTYQIARIQRQAN